MAIVDNLERDLNVALPVRSSSCRRCRPRSPACVAARLFGACGRRDRHRRQRRASCSSSPRPPRRRGRSSTPSAPPSLTAPLVQIVGQGAAGLRPGAHRRRQRDPAGQGPEDRARSSPRRRSSPSPARRPRRGGIEESERAPHRVDHPTSATRSPARSWCPAPTWSRCRPTTRSPTWSRSRSSTGCRASPCTGEGVDDVVGIVYAKDLVRAERDGGGQRPVRDAHARGVLRARDQARRRAAGRDAGRTTPTWRSSSTSTAAPPASSRSRTCSRSSWATSTTSSTPRQAASRPTSRRATSWSHDPTMNVDDLNEECDFAPARGRLGLARRSGVRQLGRVPEVGDEVEVDGYRLVVEQMDGRRVGTGADPSSATPSRRDEAEERADA